MIRQADHVFFSSVLCSAGTTTTASAMVFEAVRVVCPEGNPYRNRHGLKEPLPMYRDSVPQLREAL